MGYRTQIFGRRRGLFCMSFRALLDIVLGSFGWNIGLFWMEYRGHLVGYRALLVGYWALLDGM